VVPETVKKIQRPEHGPRRSMKVTATAFGSDTCHLALFIPRDGLSLP